MGKDTNRDTDKDRQKDRQTDESEAKRETNWNTSKGYLEPCFGWACQFDIIVDAGSDKKLQEKRIQRSFERSDSLQGRKQTSSGLWNASIPPRIQRHTHLNNTCIVHHANNRIGIHSIWNYWRISSDACIILTDLPRIRRCTSPHTHSSNRHTHPFHTHPMMNASNEKRIQCQIYALKQVNSDMKNFQDSSFNFKTGICQKKTHAVT